MNREAPTTGLVGFSDGDDPELATALDLYREVLEVEQRAGQSFGQLKKDLAAAEGEVMRRLGTTQGINGVLRRTVSKPRRSTKWAVVAAEMAKASCLGPVSADQYRALVEQHTTYSEPKMKLKILEENP